MIGDEKADHCVSYRSRYHSYEVILNYTGDRIYTALHTYGICTQIYGEMGRQPYMTRLALVSLDFHIPDFKLQRIFSVALDFSLTLIGFHTELVLCNLQDCHHTFKKASKDRN